MVVQMLLRYGKRLMEIHCVVVEAHCRHCVTPHNRTRYSRRPHSDNMEWYEQRCYDKNQSHYHLYGGRGITICDEWTNNFPREFYEWAYENGYKKGLSIDRIDNNKGYTPYNCRFVKERTACNRRNELGNYN